MSFFARRCREEQTVVDADASLSLGFFSSLEAFEGGITFMRSFFFLLRVVGVSHRGACFACPKAHVFCPNFSQGGGGHPAGDEDAGHEDEGEDEYDDESKHGADDDEHEEDDSVSSLSVSASHAPAQRTPPPQQQQQQQHPQQQANAGKPAAKVAGKRQAAVDQPQKVGLMVPCVCILEVVLQLLRVLVSSLGRPCWVLLFASPARGRGSGVSSSAFGCRLSWSSF